MKRDRMMIVALVVVIALGAVWFWFNFERVTVREKVGYQGEARANALLAAQMLIARMGAQAERIDSVAKLGRLPPDATLLLGPGRVALGREHADGLLGWVERGGRLVVVAEWHRQPDRLLEALDIGRQPVRTGAGPRAMEVTLPAAEGVMRVEFAGRQKLVDRKGRAAFVLDGPSGLQLIELARGRGRVTVIADHRFATNTEIARHDHAEFVWELARPGIPGGRGYVASRLESPSLWRLLRDEAPLALAAAALLLLAWLARITRRFGPVAPDPEAARKRLLDHLRAAGRYAWDRGGGARLAAQARESFLRRIARQHPDVAALPASERALALARRTGYTERATADAIVGTVPDARRFTNAMATLQGLEERLVRRPGKA